MGFKEGRMVAKCGNQKVSRELQVEIHGMKNVVAEDFLFSTALNAVLCSFPNGHELV